MNNILKNGELEINKLIRLTEMSLELYEMFDLTDVKSVHYIKGRKFGLEKARGCLKELDFSICFDEYEVEFIKFIKNCIIESPDEIKQQNTRAYLDGYKDGLMSYVSVITGLLNN